MLFKLIGIAKPKKKPPVPVFKTVSGMTAYPVPTIELSAQALNAHPEIRRSVFVMPESVSEKTHIHTLTNVWDKLSFHVRQQLVAVSQNHLCCCC